VVFVKGRGHRVPGEITDVPQVTTDKPYLIKLHRVYLDMG